MVDWNAFDGLYLDYIDLMKRVERVLGIDSELFVLLDEARVDVVIPSAPAGWSVRDVGEVE